MIVSGPERLVGEIHTTNDTLVELRDVMATCLDIAKAPVPTSIDGVTMLRPSSREYLHGEHQYGELSHQFIVTKTAKYIWFSKTGREQYFDLLNDPNETHDGIKDPQYQNDIEAMRKHLVKELKDRPEGYVENNHLIVGRKPMDCLPNATMENI